MMYNYQTKLRNTILFFLLFALGAVAYSCTPSYAQQPQQPFCGDTDKIVETLLKKHKEHEAIILVPGNKETILRLFLNMNTQTWTLLETYSDGTSCVGGFGEGIVFPTEKFNDEGPQA